MAKKDLKISELKKRKEKLDKDIFNLIKAFEKETGIKIDYIDFERRWEDNQVVPATRAHIQASITPSATPSGVTTKVGCTYNPCCASWLSRPKPAIPGREVKSNSVVS